MSVNGLCVYALKSLWLVYTHRRKQKEAKRGRTFRIPERTCYHERSQLQETKGGNRGELAVTSMTLGRHKLMWGLVSKISTTGKLKMLNLFKYERKLLLWLG